jgi:hypothetical protein
LLLVIGFTGCRDKISYDLLTNNHSEQKLYDCKIEELYKHVPWSGSNPGTGGGTLGITVSVPDKITITWKSIKPGKEKEVALHEQRIDAIGGEFMPEDRSNLPKYTRFPSDLYEDHEVVLTLKGTVPKKPKGGEIIITYTGNEHFDVQYIEKK